MKKTILSTVMVAVFSLFALAALAQGTITGVVVDAENDEALIGASVVLDGTTIGTVTNVNGEFSLSVEVGDQQIIISYIGYISQKLNVKVSGGQTTNLGQVKLESDAVGLSEVMVFASMAIQRKTPVAISSISAQLIENKLGSQEFPEILKSTPGVYATKSGGGFGDGRVNLRGFNSENVAVMINGVPVNDMENGRVYWSNWAGLSDVTRSMQVQRGLGASKVAVPSIGGTINIVSKTTDTEEGGNITSTVGSDGYQKIGATISTGLLDNGFAATVSAAKTVGNGYVDGTEFEGYNYFLNISKNIGSNHRISFTSFGAPQRHGQRQNPHLIETYRNAESGAKFNSDWGIRGGQAVHVEDNFYHKSQSSFNHYWSMSDKTTLSTALYGSFGSGGGGGRGGDNALFNVRLGNDDQPMDIDNVVNTNIANGSLGAVSWLRASRNDHTWFGALSTLNTELGDNLDFTAGLDLRTYTAQHFYEVTDLLGASYIYNDDDINNPNAVLRVGDKYNYNNDGNVGWQGLFTQLEYDKNNLAAFISASVSNTAYQRVDYFVYLDSDPLQTTDKYNFLGFSVKSGANYNISAKSNFFGNIGYFEKAAGFDAVFQGYDNEHINEGAVNQKIFSVELGYGYKSERLAGNLNIYRTKWNDRTMTDLIFGANDEVYFANLIGVNALHQGIELDFTYKVSEKLSTMGMISLGDWRWDNNLENVQVYDENQNPVGDPYSLYIEDVKVSDAAQTTAAFGFDYQIMPKTNFTVDFNYFADLYASYSPDGRTEPGLAQPWKIPAFSTVDASLRYGFNFGGFDAVLIGRMNNVFDTEYIADARDGAGSDAASALVWYGFGRTVNVSVKINF